MKDWTRRILIAKNAINSEGKLILKSNVRVYRNCLILAPGEYTDGLSNQTARYKADVLERCALNWDETYLNLDHNIFETLKRVGTVDPKGAKNGKVYADLRIIKSTQAGRDIIALIDANLVTDLSVEIYTKEHWNSRDHIYDIDEILFTGLAIVTEGACDKAKINTR